MTASLKSWRFCVTPVLVVSLLTGCSGTRRIPREEFESASNEQNARFTIRMVDGVHYAAWRYAVTDSTLTVESLSKHDARYGVATLPIVVPLDDVQSIEMFGTTPTAFAGAGILFLAVPVVALVSVIVYAIVSGEGVGWD